MRIVIISPILRLLNFGSYAATSHLKNTYWYLDTCDMNPCDPMADTHTASKNEVFIARWSRLSASRDVQLFGRLHTDSCKVPLFMLPGVKLQIKLTKARPRFYLMKKADDSKNTPT